MQTSVPYVLFTYSPCVCLIHLYLCTPTYLRLYLDFGPLLPCISMFLISWKKCIDSCLLLSVCFSSCLHISLYMYPSVSVSICLSSATCRYIYLYFILNCWSFSHECQGSTYWVHSAQDFHPIPTVYSCCRPCYVGTWFEREYSLCPIWAVEQGKSRFRYRWTAPSVG